MTAEEKPARHRLRVLELGQALGNVSEVCRRRGIRFHSPFPQDTPELAVRLLS